MKPKIIYKKLIKLELDNNINQLKYLKSLKKLEKSI